MTPSRMSHNPFLRDVSYSYSCSLLPERWLVTVLGITLHIRSLWISYLYFTSSFLDIIIFRICWNISELYYHYKELNEHKLIIMTFHCFKLQPLIPRAKFVYGSGSSAIFTNNLQDRFNLNRKSILVFLTHIFFYRF